MATASVLLIDDEKDFLAVLQARLEMRDLDVVTAFDGPSALEILEDRSFDAIVLDLRMPGMDGLEALRRIIAADAEAQVIVLTGRATVGDGVAAIKEGAIDLLEKPPDLQGLLDKIGEAAAKRLSLLEERSASKIDDILKRSGW